jgi:hypothetical protein
LVLDIAVVTLLVLLATKVLVDASGSEFSLRMAKFLTVPIIPLLILFVLIVALRVIVILP